MTLLVTENNSPIATESGYALSIDEMTSNDDIQAFDFSIDVMQAILWEYNDATSLQAILQSKQDWYDINHRDFWQNWYRDVFDLRTANQFGLSVWSIILGLPLYVNTPPVTRKAFGFAGSGGYNFDRGNFVDKNGSSVLLPVATQRRALQLRYLQLTGSGTVPETNRALKYIFGDLGKACLIDHHNMTQQYVFFFPLTADLTYLFDNYDILPRPAGVLSTYTDGTKPHFGFGPYGLNFDRGNFGA